MAKAVSNEELQLRKRARRRLVGAIALVLAVVVFLPMILDNEPRPVSESIPINIPPAPVGTELPEATGGEPEPIPFTKVEEQPQNQGKGSSGRVSGASQGSEPKTETAKPVAQAKPEPKPKPKPETTSTSQGYAVQLAAFSDAANAGRYAKKVRENGFNAYTEAVMTSKGERTRVRVGPYPTREAALKARDRLKARKMNLGEPDIIRPGE